jgi:methyltransferase (TIGR00027 family)
MKDDAPSLTALGVSLARSRLERPSTPTGDPSAEARLEQALLQGFEPSNWERERERGDRFWRWVTSRTEFMDGAVLQAIEEGVTQVVVLGAGYDGRALRFRAPGVRFFEVDHPATQADKRRRLDAVDASTDGITFVAADFTEDDLEDRLAAAGHDARARSLFVCEGVLRYLPEHSFHALLRASAARAAPGSVLAASISTAADRSEVRPGPPDEPVLTVPPRDVALEWVAAAGWTVESVVDVDGNPAGAPRGRLLVRAHP